MWNFIQDIAFNYDGSIKWVGLMILLAIGGVLLMFLSAIIYWIVEAIGFSIAPSQYETGKVHNKYYKPESNGVGIGTAINSNGQSSPVVTITHDSDSYIIEYKPNNSLKKYRIETNEEIYDALELGDNVKAYYKISKTWGGFKFTGWFEKIG